MSVIFCDMDAASFRLERESLILGDVNHNETEQGATRLDAVRVYLQVREYLRQLTVSLRNDFDDLCNEQLFQGKNHLRLSNKWNPVTVALYEWRWHFEERKPRVWSTEYNSAESDAALRFVPLGFDMQRNLPPVRLSRHADSLVFEYELYSTFVSFFLYWRRAATRAGLYAISLAPLPDDFLLPFWSISFLSTGNWQLSVRSRVDRACIERLITRETTKFGRAEIDKSVR